MECISEYYKNKLNSIKSGVLELNYISNKVPTVALIQIGNNKDSFLEIEKYTQLFSLTYIKYKIYNFKATCSTAKILKTINKLNKNNNISGIIVVCPVPMTIDINKIYLSIDFKKDILRKNPNNTEIRCIPDGIKKYLNSQCVQLKNKNILIIDTNELDKKSYYDIFNNSQSNILFINSSINTTELKYYLNLADIIIISAKPHYLLKKAYKYKPTSLIFDCGKRSKTDNQIYQNCEDDLVCELQAEPDDDIIMLKNIAMLKTILINCLFKGENDL